MQIVPDEDIAMFARGLLGRQGPRAVDYAQRQSRSLAKLQDAEGAKVWERVAEVASRIAKTRKHR